MRFPQPDASVDQQGVEGGAAGFLRDRVARRTRQSVAVALNKVLKGVVGIQLTLNVHLFETRNNKGVANALVASDACGKRNLWVLNGAAVGAGDVDFIDFQVGGVLVHNNGVDEPRIWTEFFGNGRLEQLDIVCLQPFVHKLGRDLQCDHLALELNRTNGKKPGLVCLRTNVVLDIGQTVSPDGLSSALHRLFLSFKFRVPFSA